METEVQNLFKISIEALHPALRQYSVSGSVFFWQYGSIRSLRHIQLMDGTIVCNKKIKFGDGSEDAIMFDGNKFYWCKRNHFASRSLITPNRWCFTLNGYLKYRQPRNVRQAHFA